MIEWKNILTDERLRPTTRTKDVRTEFESDLGRINFSPAIRRMHDKTQVFPLLTDDNIHTRLTHSLEVQSIAYSLGIKIVLDERFEKKTSITDRLYLFRTIPTILSSISLCHDIGNPPFGHYGEEIISNYFEKFFNDHKELGLTSEQKLDFLKFNGNAQGLRVLTKTQVLQDNVGLNLTIGTLSAFIKYPNLSNEIGKQGYRKTLGVFQSEKGHFERIRKITGLTYHRNPLAFLMEAADTICYRTMDIEDGFNKEYYSVEEFIGFLLHFNNPIIHDKVAIFKKDKLDEIDAKNINSKTTKMVKLRIFLIQELVDLACNNFFKYYDEIMNGTYFDELIKDSEYPIEKALGDFESTKIFSNREILSLEVAGESILTGLLNHFVPDLVLDSKSKRSKRLYGLFSKSLIISILIDSDKKKLDDLDVYYKLRLIVDYISGMTDNFALTTYQKLNGIKIG